MIKVLEPNNGGSREFAPGAFAIVQPQPLNTPITKITSMPAVIGVSIVVPGKLYSVCAKMGPPVARISTH